MFTLQKSNNKVLKSILKLKRIKVAVKSLEMYSDFTAFIETTLSKK